MAMEGVSLFVTCETGRLQLVAVYDIGLRPQVVAYDTDHQLEVAVSHIVAAAVAVAVAARQVGVAAGDAGRLGQAVGGDIDLLPVLPVAEALDIGGHPCLLVAAYGIDPPRMRVQLAASSEGSFEELPHPRGRLA